MKSTIISRGSLPSLRTLCTCPVVSMKPVPAGWTTGVQVSSSPEYSVAAPDLTETNPGPGCACQPVCPPGAIVTSRT
jgi:hypothetical protein